MKNNKMNVYRLLIFLILAFAPLWILVLCTNSALGMPLYESTNAEIIYMVGVFGMMFPAIAHLLTRLFTKEGFDNTYLMPNAEKGFRYYAAAVLTKLILVFIELILLWLVFMRELSFGELWNLGEDGEAIAALLLQLAFCIIICFHAFGEEWGWRGYMMPKLIQLLGKPFAVIAGGILWGLWHAPLTISGHNFGVDYPGFPYLGILFMCIFCVGENALLTYLTEKSGTIYPAAICHSINNGLGALVVLKLCGSSRAVELAEQASPIESMRYYLPVSVVITVVFTWLLIRKEKRNPEKVD